MGLLLALFDEYKSRLILEKNITMKTFRVAGVNIYFSVAPSREFSIRYFTVIYQLPGRKFIMRNYHHNERNFITALKTPESMEIEEHFVNALPIGIPMQYTGAMRLNVPNILQNEFITVVN